MHFFLGPNVIFLLVVAAVMLFLLSVTGSRSKVPMILMGICLLAAGYELIARHGNLTALAIVALSPLPFLVAWRQKRPAFPLLLLSVVMLTAGALYLFTDQNGLPTASHGLAGLTAAVCGEIMWIGAGRRQNSEGQTPDADSVVGMLGEACSDIENHSAGFVDVNGDRWMARSRTPIPAGRTVRVLRRDGFVLTVREEKGPKEKPARS